MSSTDASSPCAYCTNGIIYNRCHCCTGFIAPGSVCSSCSKARCLTCSGTGLEEHLCQYCRQASTSSGAPSSSSPYAASASASSLSSSTSTPFSPTYPYSSLTSPPHTAADLSDPIASMLPVARIGPDHKRDPDDVQWFSAVYSVMDQNMPNYSRLDAAQK